MSIKHHSGKVMKPDHGFSRPPSKRKRVTIDLDTKIDFVQFSTEKLKQIFQATNVKLNINVN